MLNRLLMTTAVALALAAGVNAQAQAPASPPAPQTAPSTVPAPATRVPAQPTTLSPTEVSIKSMMGAKIYAPKAGTAAASATTRASEAPATTGSTASRAMPPTISDADWNAMRENHDNIGDVANLVVNNDGRVHQIVLGVGGFLGIGEKLVAVDWADVHWMRDSNGKLFGIVQRTKQQLEAAPRFVDRT